MQINLSNIGKRYNREWIFRHLDYQFDASKKYAITGSNGSGKSTLLQIIGGVISFNEGKIECINNNTTIAPENLYTRISIVAPYMELVEEMTAEEMLQFHIKFKPLQIPVNEVLDIVGLSKAKHKQIRYYSSGMKQRLKLAQAVFCKSPVLLLDEPTTNLDEQGIELYRYLISSHTKERMLIISSNDKHEYDFCDEVISIAQYK